MTSARSQLADRRGHDSRFRTVPDPSGRRSGGSGGSRSATDGRVIAAFATDLDRTLLRPGGSPSPVGRTALREAQAMGLRTLLVSGRAYSELGRLARDFGAVDGIVAENGAVVEAPLGSPPTVVGGRSMARARRRLKDRQELHCEFGEVIVSVPRREQRLLAETLAGLSVRVTRNVDRLMVLPGSVTKRSGTRLALRQLGLGRSGYAAIGDAENDLDLLRGARFAGAVANAEPSVREAAAYVCRGRCERGVLEFVRGPLSRGR